MVIDIDNGAVGRGSIFVSCSQPQPLVKIGLLAFLRDCVDQTLGRVDGPSQSFARFGVISRLK